MNCLTFFELIDAVARTHIGQKRTENQDSYGVVKTKNVHGFILADGMGGARGGSLASKKTVELISAKIAEIKDEDITPTRIADALIEANHVVHTLSKEAPNLKGMGTTAVGLVASRSGLFLFNVGDSRTYRLRNNVLSQLTRDHTVWRDLVDSGSLEPGQALDNGISHMLTRSIGPDPEVEVDCRQIGAEDGDMLLLCSDGLYNMVSSDVIENILLEKPIDEALEHLVTCANENGGADNITVILVRMNEGIGEIIPVYSEEQEEIDFENSIPQPLKWGDSDPQQMSIEHMTPHVPSLEDRILEAYAVMDTGEEIDAPRRLSIVDKFFKVVLPALGLGVMLLSVGVVVLGSFFQNPRHHSPQVIVQDALPPSIEITSDNLGSIQFVSPPVLPVSSSQEKTVMEKKVEDKVSGPDFAAIRSIESQIDSGVSTFTALVKALPETVDEIKQAGVHWEHRLLSALNPSELARLSRDGVQSTITAGKVTETLQEEVSSIKEELSQWRRLKKVFLVDPQALENTSEISDFSPEIKRRIDIFLKARKRLRSAFSQLRFMTQRELYEIVHEHMKARIDVLYTYQAHLDNKINSLEERLTQKEKALLVAQENQGMLERHLVFYTDLLYDVKKHGSTAVQQVLLARKLNEDKALTDAITKLKTFSQSLDEQESFLGKEEISSPETNIEQ